jgi:hypothetical protein
MTDLLYGGKTDAPPPPLRRIDDSNPIRYTSLGARPLAKRAPTDAASAKQLADSAQEKARAARKLEVRFKQRAGQIDGGTTAAQGQAAMEAGDLYRQQAEHYESAARFYRLHNIAAGDRALARGDAGGVSIAQRLKDLGLEAD